MVAPIMDVDTPNLLKRCSSAPLINEVTSTVSTSPTTNTAPRNTAYFSMFSTNLQRTRRASTSQYSPIATSVNSASGWSSRPSFTPRVNQLRAEECADVTNTRELAHERETHSAMQMGQSYEDLTIMSPGLANSPTRTPRFPPVVSPSPTRKFTTRRSLSPIALRASSFSPVPRAPPPLPCKRRGDDEPPLSPHSPLSKRMCHAPRLTPTLSAPGTPDEEIECRFRPVQPMNERTHSDRDHKTDEPS